LAKKEKIRVGFIGCGGIARGHFDRLSKIPEAKVVALNDNNPKSMARFVERCPGAAKLPVYQDYRKMLDEVPLEAVEIATPHTLHFEQAIECLERGLHVLLEKPMVCTVPHAKALIAKAQEKGKVLEVSYQRHFAGAYRYVRQAVAAGDIGKLHFVTALQAQEWLVNTRGSWRQTQALSGGGQLNDSGSHLLDIVLWMTDLVPDEVFAFIDNCGTEVDILSAVSVRYEGGALGTFSVVGHSTGWWEDIAVWGDTGAFYIRDGKLLLQQGGKVADISDRCQGAGSADANFIDAILGRAEVQVPGLCGLRVIQLTEAAWKSGASGKPVQVEK